MPILADRFLLRLDMPQLRQHGLRNVLQNAPTASLFWEFAKQRDVVENISFLADLSAGHAELAGLRAYARPHAPKDANEPWVNAAAAGLYEHYVAPGAPLQINLPYGMATTLGALYVAGQGTGGPRAPNLDLAAFEDAIGEIFKLLRPAFSDFCKLIESIQQEAKAGQESFLGHHDALKVLTDERKHTADRVGRNAGGDFIIYPVAGDHKPLLQVSAEVGRAVSSERTELAVVLAVDMKSLPIVFGSWAKSGDDRRTVLVYGPKGSQAAADLFRAALAAHRVGGYTVVPATQSEVKDAFAPKRINKVIKAVHPAPAKQDAKVLKKLNQGKIHPFPIVILLYKGVNAGFSEVEKAAKEAVEVLRNQQKSAIGTAVTQALKTSTIKQGIAAMEANGNGRYWVVLYTDPEYKDTKLLKREVWLYRGAAAPEKNKDPKPSTRPKTTWFRLVSTHEASMAQLAENMEAE